MQVCNNYFFMIEIIQRRTLSYLPHIFEKLIFLSLHVYLYSKPPRQWIDPVSRLLNESRTSTSNAWFTISSRIVVETFGEMWTRWSTHKCRHSHSCGRIVDNERRHSRHSHFLWLRTNLPTCLRELWDEMRTGRECGRRDECTFHTLVLILSRGISTRM